MAAWAAQPCFCWLQPLCWQRAGNACKASGGGVAQAGEMPRQLQRLAVTPACVRLDTHPLSLPVLAQGCRRRARASVQTHSHRHMQPREPRDTSELPTHPHVHTHTHAQNPARSQNTCLPSSCSAHASPPLPAQPGSSAAASPHVHILRQTLTSRDIPTGTCLCSSPALFRSLLV